MALSPGCKPNPAEQFDGLRAQFVSLPLHPGSLAGSPRSRSRTSRTVRDLVAGSGIAFAERGGHNLTVLPAEWPLFAIAGL